MFAGSDRGRERELSIFSLIVPAKMNDVDPWAWVPDVLARIGDHPATRLDQLLPWNWEKTAAAIVVAARKSLSPGYPPDGLFSPHPVQRHRYLRQVEA